MRPAVTSLDHLVLTVRDASLSLSFYTEILGMAEAGFAAADGTRRLAVRFGDQKINLHVAGREIAPYAARATPGSADLCFLTQTPLDAWAAHLRAHGVAIEAGPVARRGATGPIRSIYLRDPDANLIEIAVRDPA